MNIYGISDIHLGIKNKKINEKIENVFTDILENKINKEESLVLISGDLFAFPIVSNKIFDFLISSMEKVEDFCKFIIIPGNHDFSPIHKPSSIELFSKILNINNPKDTDLKNGFIIKNYIDLPKILIVDENPLRIFIEDRKVMIDALPFMFNKEGMNFDKKIKLNKDFKRIALDSEFKILMCHGVIEEIETDYKSPDSIKKSTIRGYDFVLKGDIHKTFSIENYNVYSPGSLNRLESGSECSYISIDLNDIVNPKIEINNIDESFLINYKLFNSETKETINETLKEIGKNDIVKIYYKGESSDIDEKEYFRCFHECLKFSFVFDDKNILKGEDLISINRETKEFKNFFSYMEDFFSKSEENSKMEKIYNSIKDEVIKKGV